MSDAIVSADLMDRIYRHQRHIYDLTRKYYLLGRDRLIARLSPARGMRVLEIGSGTARNLVRAARAYPDIDLFGIDISHEMLETARRTVVRERLTAHIQLAQADATRFDPALLFGTPESVAASRIHVRRCKPRSTMGEGRGSLPQGPPTMGEGRSAGVSNPSTTPRKGAGSSASNASHNLPRTM